jgi:Glycosyl transferase 4-like domain
MSIPGAKRPNMSDHVVRHCLIISPHFPPSTLAGVHRARHLAKHLPRHGWLTTVVCVDPRQHVEPLDPELAQLVPAGTSIIKVGAIPVAWTRPFGLIGEIGLRGFFHLRAAIAHSVEQRRPDAILITGSPFYPMLLSGWIRRKWDIPVVLDFQDPWVSREGASRRRWSKGRLSHRLAVMLEPWAVRAASWITSVSGRQNEEMAERYPDLDPRRMAAIPIGGDPEDFAALREMLPTGGKPDRITFSYVGTALPRSTPLFEALFGGIAELRRRNPGVCERIAFRFVGTSNQPGRDCDFRLTHLAAAAGVADIVSEEPGRVPYLEALRILATTDATLMIGSDEPHYTASKIYPCLMSGRPFLSLFHPDSSAHHILSTAGGGIPLAYSLDGQLGETKQSVADAIERIVVSPRSLGVINPAAYADYTADAVAAQFADVFERAGLY